MPNSELYIKRLKRTIVQELIRQPSYRFLTSTCRASIASSVKQPVWVWNTFPFRTGEPAPISTTPVRLLTYPTATCQSRCAGRMLRAKLTWTDTTEI